jgi:predicted permease
MLDIFAVVLGLIPLYFYIAMGYVAARYLNFGKHDMPTLVIYMLVPLVFFGSIATSTLDASYLWLPFIAMVMSSVIALITYAFSKRVYGDANANLLAQAAGTANTGYYGIPLFLLLFPADKLGGYMLVIVGINVFEATLGYYLIARGQFSPKESIAKLLRMPMLYACVAGIAYQTLGLPTFTGIAEDILLTLRSTYIVAGMMMLGIGLGSMQSLKLDWTFITISCAAKFILWPLVVAGFVVLDTFALGLLDGYGHGMLMMLVLVPMAANTVSYAALLNIHPEKAATATLISTLLAVGVLAAAVPYLPRF